MTADPIVPPAVPPSVNSPPIACCKLWRPVRWSRWRADEPRPSAARNAIRIERVNDSYLAFFGDGGASVYALDAATGKQLWKVKVDDNPVARVTGSIAFRNDRLYVPVASGEEQAGASPSYECCK